jgi:hypothetical protein
MLLHATVPFQVPQDKASPHPDKLPTTLMEVELSLPKEPPSPPSPTIHIPHNAKSIAVHAQQVQAHPLLPQPEPDIGILLEESVFMKPLSMLAVETTLNKLLDTLKAKKHVLMPTPTETQLPQVDNASQHAFETECSHLILRFTLLL